MLTNMARALNLSKVATLRWSFPDLKRSKNRPALVLSEPDSRLGGGYALENPVANPVDLNGSEVFRIHSDFQGYMG